MSSINSNTPKFHQWFHQFLIYFALFALGILVILVGARNILYVYENGYGAPEMPLSAVINGLMIAAGCLMIKARFDLAAFRESAPREILIAFVAAGILTFGNIYLENLVGDELTGGSLITAVVFICWGISVYKYYADRTYLFHQAK